MTAVGHRRSWRKQAFAELSDGITATPLIQPGFRLLQEPSDGLGRRILGGIAIYQHLSRGQALCSSFQET